MFVICPQKFADMDTNKFPRKHGIPNLNRREDYITWKRKMLAYLEEGDADLLCLEPVPDPDVENHKDWL